MIDEKEILRPGQDLVPEFFVVGRRRYHVAPHKLELWFDEELGSRVAVVNQADGDIVVEIVDRQVEPVQEKIECHERKEIQIRLRSLDVDEFAMLVWGPLGTGRRAEACSDPRIVVMPRPV